MTHYKRAYSKYMFCGKWSLFANPVTYTDFKNIISDNNDLFIITWKVLACTNTAFTNRRAYNDITTLAPLTQ